MLRITIQKTNNTHGKPSNSTEDLAFRRGINNTFGINFDRGDKLNPDKSKSESSLSRSDLHEIKVNDYESRVLALGKQILSQGEGSGKSIFSKDWWYGKIMDWSMKNETFKTQMFRFVDVLPSISSAVEINRHINEYFDKKKHPDLPSIMNIGTGVGNLAPSLAAKAIKKNVEQMAKMFITADSPEKALPILVKKRKQALSFTADLLGEATLSEQEALEYQDRYIALINALCEKSQALPDSPLLDTDDQGAIPKVNVSVKLTSLYSQVNIKAWEETKKTLIHRLLPIFECARKNFVFVNIDMESYEYKDLTLDIFKSMLSLPQFKDYPHFGIVIQAYLKDSLQDIKDLGSFAQQRGTPFSIRLVKGAYWDYETIHSQQQNWPIPVFTNKHDSDINFENCAEHVLSYHPNLKLAVGSHNVRSIAATLVLANNKGLPINAVEVQMLYGMADEIKVTLAKMGYRVREYMTIGEMLPGMAYLVRRLLENTANESFLRHKYSDNQSMDVLLKNPRDFNRAESLAINRVDFSNEALLDFHYDKERESFKNALEAWKPLLGIQIPTILNGKNFINDNRLKRFNPSQPDQLICEFSNSSIEQADQAIATAKQAISTWRETSVESRCLIFEKLAQLIQEKRHQLASLQVLEVGKPWSEADGDITEAIDFCRYYATQMRTLGIPKKIGHTPGETSHYHYIPRGVGAVIAPWNFPLAILTGQVVGTLITGNTALIKPAEQSTMVAFHLMQLLLEAGVPPEVVHFLPGQGEIVGRHLVDHPDVSLIAFTGSKTVGLEILNKSSIVKPGQTQVKKCIIEMGGKNAVIIDNDADLDEAVVGVLYSAFGFSGQKCSACSRVIILDEVYEKFKARLIEATKSIEIGNPENPRFYTGPVVDEDSFSRLNQFIQEQKNSNTIAFQGEVPKNGYFVAPTIFSEVSPHSTLAQTELFGPVLALIKVNDIKEAIAVANNTEYALTGGLYSRSPENIDRVKNQLEVGNVYINRSITGAMVNRHPFGGYKLSGLGSKTGGPDYLKEFLEPRVYTENTMRRGFAPNE